MQKNARVVSIDSYEDVAPYNEKALKKAVANQPVSISMEGSGIDFQLYESVYHFLFSCKLQLIIVFFKNILF